MRVATQAVQNAEDAERIARKASEDRDAAIKQRDEYRSSRDATRTQRDQLAGQLFSVEIMAKQYQQENTELAERAIRAQLRQETLASQRWYFAAGGIVLGVLITGTALMVAK